MSYTQSAIVMLNHLGKINIFFLVPLCGQFDASCFKSAEPPNALAPQVGKPAHATTLAFVLKKIIL